MTPEPDSSVASPLTRYSHGVLRSGDNVFPSFHPALRQAVRGMRQRFALSGQRVITSGPRPEVRVLASHLPSRLVIADAGCRWGFAPQWEMLSERVRLIGFEPDEEECARLRERYAGRDNVELVPLALGSQADRLLLRRFANPAVSSFHPHDEHFLAHLAIPRGGDVLQQTIETDLVTLDEWSRTHGVERIDVLKLDVQGHELEILRGAEAILSGVRAIEAEVCLNPITAGTPLFGAIDAWLRERGFVLWRLRDVAHYPLAGGEGAPGSVEAHEHLGASIRFATPPGMISWANAHYVRQEMFARDAELGWEQRLRDTILADALCFHDLAAWSQRMLLREAAPEPVSRDVEASLEALDQGGMKATSESQPALPAGWQDGKLPRHRLILADRRLLARKAFHGALRRLRWLLVRDAAIRASLQQINERLDQIEDSLVESSAYVARALRDLRDQPPP